MARKTAWRLAFAGAVTVQLIVLYWPAVPVQGPPDSDKLVHLLLFAVPAYLGVVALGQWWPAALVLAVHAPVSELLQGRVLPSRSGTAADAVADLVGVALGVALGLGTSSTLRRPRGDPPNGAGDVTIDG